uniref:Uncharacterized protein n=1 Tax=Solibacter usitatus (strain Ellin6076) TaxID=234267 RepID=Q01V40_SOLUE
MRAFFCLRGSRDLFLEASLGILIFEGGVAFLSAVTPTAAAIFPAAVPRVFAAVSKMPSGASSVFFFFAIVKFLLDARKAPANYSSIRKSRRCAPAIMEL